MLTGNADTRLGAAEKLSRMCDAPCLASPGRVACDADGRLCLVKAAREGNGAAQELLFSMLYTPVRQQARRLCLDRGDAEDLTQLSLLAVFQKMKQLRDRSRLLWWTREVVRTSHLMSLRRSRFAPVRGEETILQDFELVERGRAVDHLLETREMIESTLAGILCLSPCLRDVVELRIFQGKNTAQTAQSLHISRAAVRTRLKRAREALRQSLQRAGSQPVISELKRRRVDHRPAGSQTCSAQRG